MRHPIIQLTYTALLAVYCTQAASAQGPSAYPASASMSPPAPPSAGVFLNNSAFDIPFTVERTGAQPVEVQLFVSRDQGQSWKFFARQPANENGFPFQAAEDGDFWFSTRTIDARGVSYPTGPMAPQLRVFVDTTNPKVEARADTDELGQVALDYAIVDAAPDEGFLRLEYMTDAVRQWMPISIQGRPGRRPADGALVGRITWKPQTEWRQVYIRMIVRDKAGNQTVVNEQVDRPRVAANPVSFASNSQQPGGEMSASTVSGRPAFSGAATPPMVPQQANSPTTTPTPSHTPASAASNYRGAHPMPTQAVSNPGAPELNAPVQSQPTQMQSNHQPAPTPIYNPHAAAMPTKGQSSVFTQPAPSQERSDPVAPREAMRPLTATTVSAANTQPTRTPAPSTSPAHGNAAATTPTRPLSLNDTPRVSRSKQFSLDYEVESIGNGGVDAVELWGTRDGGASWKRWNADPDKQSPFDIEVANEGLVGFRIVVVAANGLTTPRPQPGDPADIYILVDTTAPRARLTGATYGKDQYAGSLIIDYACHDDNFGDRPISLAFSAEPQGEWTTIATGLANTGRYVWPADPQLPREIYLRIEATDKAGNVGIHALDVPIAAQGLSPQGHIRGFEPIDGGPQAQQASKAPTARFR